MLDWVILFLESWGVLTLLVLSWLGVSSIRATRRRRELDRQEATARIFTQLEREDAIAYLQSLGLTVLRSGIPPSPACRGTRPAATPAWQSERLTTHSRAEAEQAALEALKSTQPAHIVWEAWPMSSVMSPAEQARQTALNRWSNAELQRVLEWSRSQTPSATQPTQSTADTEPPDESTPPAPARSSGSDS